MIEQMKTVFRNLKKRIDTPPAYLLNEAKYHKTRLAHTRREILTVKAITWLFLIASIHQVAWIFSGGDPELWHYLKAIGVDGAIFFLSQAITKRAFEVYNVDPNQQKKRGRPSKAEQAAKANGVQSMAAKDRDRVTTVLWIGVACFMVSTTIMNTLYEFWAGDAASGFIAYNLDQGPLVILTKVLASSFLAPIVVFMTFVASLFERQMVTGLHALKAAEIEEAKKSEERAKAREYRRAVANGEIKVRTGKRGRPRKTENSKTPRVTRKGKK